MDLVVRNVLTKVLEKGPAFASALILTKKSAPFNGTLYIRSNSLCSFNRSFLFLDPCALTASLTLVVQFRTAYTARLVQDDRVNVRGKEREKPFNTHSIRNLTNSKGSSSAFALLLDHIT